MELPDRTGVLLVNLGTPAAPTAGAVRRYLREFLSDPRVIDVPAPLRFLLVNLLIAPWRAPKSAAAYRKVWTAGGSPLMVHSLGLRDALRVELAPLPVELGMRYGEPGIGSALEALRDAGCGRVVVFPLYPQYASSSTGTALEKVYTLAGKPWNAVALDVVGPFFDHPAFLDALAAVVRESRDAFRPDHVLFSFHGLPERHVRKSDRSGTRCLARPECCDALEAANADCYRAQCFATARGAAARLVLPRSTWSVSFQSRLGRSAWIPPNTEERLRELARDGTKRVLVACPAFVSDCLETLEEIGLRARDLFRAAGGEDLRLVPGLNARTDWVHGAAALVREAAGAGRTRESTCDTARRAAARARPPAP